jgi:uncharacterized protein (TIGR03083 family)
MTGQEKTEKRWSKAELLERMRTAYEDLGDTLRPLSNEQLSRPGPEGWAVKDHLAHLAAWELGVAELLQRRSRFAAMLIEEAMEQGKDIDEINDLIYRQNTGLSPSEALEKFHAAHRQMLQALDVLSDEDLYRPYASYVPEGSQGPQDPVLRWIASNTFEHFEEHNGWIGELLSSRKSK